MVNQTQALQSTTQKYLEIYDITNDVVILQDGAVSMVLNTTAINFDLYSEEEQDAVIYAYAALLNSLSFPIEIVIRSQKKDVSSYLDLLKDQEMRAYTPVNKKNIREYREFVEQLVQERNVLDKKFYIIITFTALEAGLATGSSFLPQLSKKEAPVLDKHTILERALTNLEPRRDHLIHQFARIGLFAKQLKTQELIQLFYTIYNPDASKGSRVGTSDEYASPLVQADVVAPERVVVPPTLTNTTQQPTIASLPQEQVSPPTPPSLPPSPSGGQSLASASSPSPSIISNPLPPESTTPISVNPTPPSTAPSPITSPTSSIQESPGLSTDLTPPTPPPTPPTILAEQPT